jgi:hypothetical protein
MRDNSNRVVTLIFLGWLCFAVGLSGWFSNASAPAVAATVWTLTAALLTWNTLGLIDIVFVVFSARRFGLQDWQSMRALRELPLSLLPTFLVPLIVASHVLIFVLLI